MITPFGLRHILLVRDLQSRCAVLDINSALTEPVAPLQAALRGYFLGPRSGIFTYVLQAPHHEMPLRGFAQTRALGSGAVWRILRLAPALDSSLLAPSDEDGEGGARSAEQDLATVWYRLLLHLCIAAGEWGVQRLFARLTAESPAEEVFRQAGFAVYTHERVLVRPPAAQAGGATPSKGLSPNVRAVQPEDHWHAQRLYHKVTPRLVAQVEELNDAHGEPHSLEMPSADMGQSYALYGRNGAMLGYLSLCSGLRGSWLQLIMDPDAQGSHPNDCAAEMLDHTLAVAANKSSAPLYCAVREYQGGIQALLEDRGFALVDNHSLLVKHTTVRVREAVRKRAPALEKRAEVAPTLSRSGANGEVL